MSATSKERSKAARLRRRADLTPSERAWLDSYEARRARTPPPPTRRPEPPAEVSIEPLFAATPPPPQLERDDDDDGPELEREDWPELERDDDDDRPELERDEPEETPTEPHCNIGPDCPECSKAKRGGARRCDATGRMAWPPMEPRQLQAQAAVALGATGLVARGLRRFMQGVTSAYVPPTDEERADLADALDTIQRMHAGWLAFGAEWLALGRAVGGYGLRVYRAPVVALPDPGTGKPRTNP